MILHVITDFVAPEGAQTMLLRLARAWSDTEHAIVSLRGTSAPLVARMPANATATPLSARTARALPQATLALARIIERRRPTAVVCWMYHSMVIGLVAARLARTRPPVFFTVRQSLDDPSTLTASTRAALRAAALMSRAASGIVYNATRSQALHEAAGYSSRNAVVIPNGFDIPPALAVARGPARVFGIAARLHPQKDHATFFNAAAAVLRRYPDARFVAAGRGLEPGSPAVAALLAGAGLPAAAVELRGEVSGMASFYDAIDVLVLSSRTEGFPNVVAEAMSFGRPVVVTDVGDAAAVAGDAGLVVPPGDAAALAEAMVTVADWDPACFRACAARARARVEAHFALPAVAARYRAFVAGELPRPRAANENGWAPACAE